LTHTFTYNNIESLQKLFTEYKDQFAAVILEPMNIAYPETGFLEAVKELTHKNGAVLVFDETITGFRYSKGGAQEYFGVTPDLATFGKGLANGYPVSAVAGRGDLMRLMEEVFFSFTFGGETLSLAASLATMTKLQKEPVIETITATGKKILEGLNALIEKHDVNSFLSTAGHPAWSFFVIKDTPSYSMWEIKTLWMQEMFARGILAIGTHNVSFAHTAKDVATVIAAYDEVIGMMKTTVENKQLKQMLRCEPLKPLFKVR
jgi:glutamate-1-semialdehyde 2,1-aminomutase